MYLLGACCDNLMLEEITIDEDIDNYCNCLDEDDKSYSFEEEVNIRNFGIQTRLNENLMRMHKAEQTRGKDGKLMHLQGVHCYDILRNPAYHQAFQYFPANQEDRDKLIVDYDDDTGNQGDQSDVVKIALNMAFMTKEQIEKLVEFDDGLKINRPENSEDKKMEDWL